MRKRERARNAQNEMEVSGSGMLFDTHRLLMYVWCASYNPCWLPSHTDKHQPPAFWVTHDDHWFTSGSRLPQANIGSKKCMVLTISYDLELLNIFTHAYIYTCLLQLKSYLPRSYAQLTCKNVIYASHPNKKESQFEELLRRLSESSSACSRWGSDWYTPKVCTQFDTPKKDSEEN